MAIHYAPKIVTDGLVLHLDAANPKSYSGTGTTWLDLSPTNFTGSFSSPEPTYNSSGYLSFNGTNNSVSLTGNVTVTEATFTSWINRTTSATGFPGIIYSRGLNQTGLTFRSTVYEIGYTWNALAESYNWASGLVTPLSRWCMIALTVKSDSATAYLCQNSGISSATNTLSHSQTTLNALVIGSDTVANRYYKGDLAIAQIYNRALTAAEIQQNFNAMRGRFGI